MTAGPSLVARGIARILLGTLLLSIAGADHNSTVAADRQIPGPSPGQYVGPGGKPGSYQEVQAELDRLEWQEVRHTSRKATLSLAELYAGQMRWRDALDNLEVEFHYSSERRVETARIRELKKERRAVPADYAFDARIAVKGEKRYTYLRDVTPSTAPLDNLENERGARIHRYRPEFIYAYNGSQMRRLELNRSIGYIDPAKLPAMDSNHSWYFNSLSILSGPLAASQRNSAWFVPTALQMGTIYRVLPELQDVDGFQCHVATSGPDTLWIDARHGFCLRRRVWFASTDLNSPPVIANVYVNKNFQQYDAGISLPHQCYRIDFAGPQEPKETQGTLTDVHTVVAKTIRVNNVNDALFELKFPPGTAVRDLVANRSYLVPHGENLLEDAIARADPIVNGKVIPSGLVAAPPAVVRDRRWLLIANGVVLTLFAIGILWRRWHPSRNN